mmetsp:Transcript_58282/g.133749  ORF Transcript_58282/g.133749 Transcript_58282/m.133749 type:complete len:264 (+) Transcript_58282:618-1409(+)
MPTDQASAAKPYGGGGSASCCPNSCQYQIATSGAAYSGVPCSPVRVPSPSSSVMAAQCRSARCTSHGESAACCETCTASGFKFRSATEDSCARLTARTILANMGFAMSSDSRPRLWMSERRSVHKAPRCFGSSEISISRRDEASTSCSRTSEKSSESSTVASWSRRWARIAAHSSSAFPGISSLSTERIAYLKPVSRCASSVHPTKAPASAPFSSYRTESRESDVRTASSNGCTLTGAQLISAEVVVVAECRHLSQRLQWRGP